MIQTLIAIAFCLLIFLVLREVMMWYWKINAMIENQEKIINLLERQNKHIDVQEKHYRFIENNMNSNKEVR